MSMLRTGGPAASAYDPDGWDNSREANYRKAIRIISLIPTLIGSYDRHRQGLEPIEPNPKLPHAANFLYMVSGEEPSQEAADAMDVAFMVYVNHALARKQRIMGFGHRVYKTEDPRATILRRLAGDTGDMAGDTRWYEIA